MSKLIAPARLIQLRAAYARARRGSSYWRSRLPDIPTEQVGVGTLSTVPVHTSADLRRLGDALRIRTGVPDSVRFTGGTTGSPVPVCHAVEPEKPPTAPTSGLRGLGLTPTSGAGGPMGMIAGRHGLLQAPMRHLSGYLYAIDLLQQEHDFPGFGSRIRFIAMPLPMLKRLLYLMASHDCGPTQHDVRTILTWGYHLSPGWRQRVHTLFPKASINVTYGFSETRVRAPACRDCGAHHYGPDAVWEVLDPLTDKPIDEGFGRIVVTPLSDRDTVLFRYAPGDMVLRTPPCSLVEEPGFRFAGRESQMVCVDVDGSRVHPVWPVHVQEAVDTAHWIGRYNAPRHTGMTSTEGDGHPMWRIRSIRDGRGIAVDLQLQYDPRLFPEAWGRHRARALASLTRSSDHPQAFQGDAPIVEIVGLPPGTLSGEEVFRC